MEPANRHKPQEKLDIVLRSYAATNIVIFSSENGIDRTTLYAWRRELAQAGLASWQRRRAGRPSNATRDTVESLRAALTELSARYQRLEHRTRDLQIWADAAKGLVERDVADGLSRLLLGGQKP
jgi:transposase-like protein